MQDRQSIGNYLGQVLYIIEKSYEPGDILHCRDLEVSHKLLAFNTRPFSGDRQVNQHMRTHSHRWEACS